jgi:excisionase family DNA binding protein
MDFMTVEEVAARLRVKKSWVYAHANELGGYRLGKYLRFFWPRVLESLDKRNGPLDRSYYDPMQTPINSADKIGREQIKNKSIA